MVKSLVGVKFRGNNVEYVFDCYDDVAVGDLVVVDTKLGYNVATVTNLSIDKDSLNLPANAMKEVVSKVDTTAFEERKRKAKKVRELKEKMDRKVKELQNIAIYEALAEKDPELKEMLSELKDIL